ncbi:MAG: glycoside hydrolase family 2 protein [Mangrovibacterium sp.]
MKQCVFVLLLSLLSYLSFSKENKLKKQGQICRQTISLNGNAWRIATDSSNEGRQKFWFQTPPFSKSSQTPVPWIIQDIFHDYHGIVWYWREFDTPENPHQGGRFLLKFHTVDYLAEVWINGKSVGSHEGSETPFEIDVTGMLNAGGKNLLAVRVLNPTYEPIDGTVLKDTPSSLKHYPFRSNSVYNSGGLTGDVELLLVPAVRITDVVVVPDWRTGKVKVQTTILNTQSKGMLSSISFRVTEARTGTLLVLNSYTRKMNAGSNSIEIEMVVPDFKLWCPDEPNLYRIMTSVQSPASSDENSVRFGFRDFRFEDGYFRLNGKRFFLKGSNFSTHYPVGYTIPLVEDMLRRDVINMKSLGFNFVRIPFGCPNPRVLDIYDELGILVQQEHYGCWQMGQYGEYDFPKPDNLNELLLNRFENSVRGVIQRDRNHACVVMWGVLNENFDGIIFRKAVELLPSLRMLDPSRLFVLNSGRFDGIKEIGSMSNPGSAMWNVGFDELKDWHPYVWMPYSSKTLDELSGRSNSSNQKYYISETGLCFPIDLPSELGDYQMWGKEQSDDALYFKRQYDKFLADWKRFDLSSCWPRPEDYVKDAYKTAASLRETAETAIRSNPFVVSYTPTNSVADYSMGESVATNFRRLKPELIEPVLLANTSLRWCLSTEPQSIYRGNQIQLKASFSNLDVLKAGKYPATIQVFDPYLNPVFEKKVMISIPEAKDGVEPPFAQTVLTEEITINGRSGEYRFLATLDQGGMAMGGKTTFYVTDKADFPKMPEETVMCGADFRVNSWLKERNVKIHPFDQSNKLKRQVILITEVQDSTTMLHIARQMACGSIVVFLSPATFKSGKNTTRWLPLVDKGIVEMMDHVAGYYRADRWAKNHPIFDGLPSGGMMDYKYFRNVISLYALSQEYVIPAKSAHTDETATVRLNCPSETICGATRISHTYCSGIHIGVWNFGQGQFIVNTLNIAENLGKDPAADRLFCNILNFASGNINEPMTELPATLNQQLTEIQYQK